MTKDWGEVNFDTSNNELPIELCRYDGSEESMNDCTRVMCENLAVQRGEDGTYPGQMIMVSLWARLIEAERAALR